MPDSPYFQYIQRYFPAEQWENADCISTHECSPSREGYPESCIGFEGYIDCAGRPTADPRYSYGPFQIFESCWDPGKNPNSPFTPEQWSQVLDPNVNTWMASVIWSRSGWSAWSTCHGCGVCDVQGGAIPYPDGPIYDIPDPGTLPGEISAVSVFLFGMALLVGSGIYYLKAKARGG
ncbi:MAG: hypothetical protein C4534_08245 [Gaiellales bacterium]|nr:MAG: hypothetical protein C4534_08245 [Gaiellales bacterium]